MWKNILGHKAMTPSELGSVIVAANAASLGIWRKPLENIILNVHGYPGGLHIGGMYETSELVRQHFLQFYPQFYSQLRRWCVSVGSLWVL